MNNTGSGSHERVIYRHSQVPVGVDEVGRGCLAGPVCVGVVNIPESVFQSQWDQFLSLGVTDSKKLSPMNRKKIISELSPFSIRFSVGIASAAEIDRDGIVGAISRAIYRASVALCVQYRLNPADIIGLFDGSMKPYKYFNSDTIYVRGDQTIPSISLASIIAKEARDAYMNVLHTRHPLYHWKTNKGYGSLAHRFALEQYGITRHHRSTFCKNYKAL